MRIVAGLYGGQSLTAPKTDNTRPMTDKVRAAIFDMLGPLDGQHVLDVYAGSGAVGIEALSRGAGNVQAVEPSRQAIRAIQSNVENLRVTWGFSLYEMTVETFLARQTVGDPFDLIFADPPYDQLKEDVLERLGPLLADGGLLVLSHTAKIKPPVLTNLELVKSKSYGDSALSIYRTAVLR